MSTSLPGDLYRTLFLDVETCSGERSYKDLPTRLKTLWDRKCRYWLRTNKESKTVSELYNEKAAVYAEFGRVICISAGYLHKEENGDQFKMKSWFGHDEFQLLNAFAGLVEDHFNAPAQQGFCGHNIKEFDIPYLCRRMLVRRIKIPRMLNFWGKKPWELNHIHDTLEIWKFGDFKHYISLDLLAALLDIRSPKDSMIGSAVSRAYYDGRMQEIVKYCEKDVLTVFKIYLRLLNLSPEFEVINVENERYD